MTLARSLRTYDELIEHFKKIIPELNPNWTNVSDDDLGIVIVKLIAILGDELNFRYDMMTLESYLGSVRERSNAQSLLNLIGYSLNTYVTSESQVLVKYDLDQSYSTPYVIPKFTEFSTQNGSIKYYSLVDSYVPAYVTSGVLIDVYEGIYKKESRLSTEIDSAGRLYLKSASSANIAENAIVITYNGNQRLERVSNILINTDSMKYQLMMDHSGSPYI